MCCVWDHYLTVCCHCTFTIVHGLVRFACADWPLLCGSCYALTLEVVCVGVMDTSGHISRQSGGVYGWWGFKSVSKILSGKVVESSLRRLFLVYSA